MSKIERDFLCLYGHFSQPPRGNPLTRQIGTEEQAAPDRNWNERILNACYQPNAEADNYRFISFSFSEALLSWLERRAPETYARIVESDQKTALANHGAGNALATAYHHTILPLARKRDKLTQILWGIAAFEQRFGRKPLGFWLPEMAVDTETLSILAECGVRYTLLAQRQIADQFPGGAGPFSYTLPSGKSIAIFVRDDRMSSDISFNIHALGGAGHWARNVLLPARKTSKDLLLLATAGETFGFHYAGEEQFLHWLVKREAVSAGYRTTTLDQYFMSHEPQKTIQIQEPSSWSDQHGLTSWATGMVADGSDTTWRGALRRALDNAAGEIDYAFESLARAHQLDPWELRNQYAPVLLGQMTGEEFVNQYAPQVQGEVAERFHHLLSAEELIQRSYNSYTFTDTLLSGNQPRYAISCTAAALSLAQRASGRHVGERLTSDLAVVSSSDGQIKGTDILRSVIEEFSLAVDSAR